MMRSIGVTALRMVACGVVLIAATAAAGQPVAEGKQVRVHTDTPRQIVLTGWDAAGRYTIRGIGDPAPNALTYTVVTAPAHGTLGGTAQYLTYVPAAGYTGADSFSFKVTDGGVDSAPALVSLNVTAFTPPLGIPAPVFGLTESHRMYIGQTFNFGAGAVPYPDAGNGPYTHYVDNTVAGATDTNNTFGTPARPRLTVPRNLPAGSVVEVHGGPYTYLNHPDGTLGFSGTGTAARPIFIRGTSTTARPRFTHGINGFYDGMAYMIVEHLDLYGFDVLGPNNPVGADAHHVALRHCHVNGDAGGGGVGAASWTNHTVHEVLFYNNLIHDNGNVDADFDQDVHGVSVGGHCSNIWVLDNEMYRSSGDGIQINTGGGFATGFGTGHHFYVGRNEAHHNKQTGFWTKQATHVIFSQNVSHAHRPGNSSFGAGMGMQYGPENVWFLANRIYDCETGIGVASNSVGQAGLNSYFIGNVIHNIHHTTTFNPNSGWSQSGIMLAGGGTNKHVLNNTIYDVDAGINLAVSGGNYIVANNLVSRVTEPLGNHVFIVDENGSTGWSLRNSLFYQDGAAVRIRFRQTTLDLPQAQQQWSQVQNCLAGNPLFVNAAADNFHIGTGSPAIDTGSVEAAYAAFQTLYGLDIRRDFDGVSRPQHANWDIGAYEFNFGNRPPVFPSTPQALPNPAPLNTPVTFTATANDPDGDPLSFIWSFSDGAPSLNGAAVTRSFAAAGTFTASVVVSDGQSQVNGGDVTVTIIAPPKPPPDTGNTGGGKPADGTPGTGSGNNGNGGGAGGTAPKPFTVAKMLGKMRFDLNGKDGVQLSGVLPELPAGFTANGATVTLDVGGAAAEFTLNAKGAAKTAQGTFALLKPRGKKKNAAAAGGTAFKATLRNGAWVDDWTDEGVAPNSVADATIRVSLEVNGTPYAVDVAVKFGAKRGSGKFKK